MIKLPNLFAQLKSPLSCLVVSALMIFLTIFLFTKLTKYNDWEEIAKGNLAAALALGGKVFGVANIMRFAITTNNNAFDVIFWAMVGLALQMLIYLALEWLTPYLDVNRSIAQGNVAVGFMSLDFSVAFSYLIGASTS